MSGVFRFKQFSINQSTSPFKVGTDGVLLGAWANFNSPQHLLDVGTGTGLIALMLAQRFPKTTLQAIEINSSAAKQAKVNFKNSPFAKSCNLKEIGFQDFEPVKKYDGIVCNPPFFTASKLSGNTEKDLARHTIDFSVGDFLEFCSQNLTPLGSLCVIIPIDNQSIWETKANEMGLFLNKMCTVHPKINGPAKRILLQFRFSKPKQVVTDKLELEIERHVYTKEYKELTGDFYL